PPASGGPAIAGGGVGPPTAGVAVGVDLEVGVDVGPPGAGAGVTVTVGPGTAAALQVVGAVILSLIRVTAPVCAMARPTMVALSLRVMLARARMVPTKVVVVSRVAELPTCQKTLQACAPLVSLTVAP